MNTRPNLRPNLRPNPHPALLPAGLALSLAFSASTALAHHSFAMFDRDKVLTLDATVKAFQWTNPHSWIQVDAAGPDGAVKEWSIESNSTGTLYRQGWKPTSFKPGDKVMVRIYPMKDGSAGGSFVGARFGDGHVLGKMD